MRTAASRPRKTRAPGPAVALIVALALGLAPASALAKGKPGGDPPGFGSDTTPPDPVVLQVQLPETADSATLTWYAPADDGSDPASGPAEKYQVRYIAGGTLTAENWASAKELFHGLTPGEPGSPQSLEAVGLRPGVEYSIGLKSQDDVLNWSAMSEPVTVTPDPDLAAWTSTLVEASGPNGESALAFGPGGQASIAYWKPGDPSTAINDLRYAHDDPVAGWVLEPIGIGYRIDHAYSPAGVATVAWSDAENGEIVVGRRVNGAWQAETVDATMDLAAEVSLAFDSAGNPAVAYHCRTGQRKRAVDEVRVARFQGNWDAGAGSWVVESVETISGGAPGWVRIAMGLDPQQDGVWVAHEGNPDKTLWGDTHEVVLHHWDGAAWSRDVVDQNVTAMYGDLALRDDGSQASVPCLAYEGAYSGSGTGPEIRYLEWTGPGSLPETALAQGGAGSVSLVIDGAGRALMACMEEVPEPPEVSHHSLMRLLLRQSPGVWTPDETTLRLQLGWGLSLALDAAGDSTHSLMDREGLLFGERAP